MKKVFSFIIAAVFVSTTFFYIYVLWSPYGLRTQRNAKNVQNLALGMKADDALRIMGAPDKIFPSRDGSTIYHYEPPFASSDGIDIYFDSTKSVKRIIFE